MDMFLIKQQLNSSVDEKFQKFTAKIVNSRHQILGVTIPNLRAIAKQIVREDAVAFLNQNQMSNYEEMMLQGFVVGYSKLPAEIKLKYLDDYVSRIADWSECDSVVATLKFFGNDQDKIFKYLDKFFCSDKEFEKRFAIVSYLNYFLNDDYIDLVLDRLLSVKSSYYYVNMAVAWAVSVCFVKYFEKTLSKFTSSELDIFTFNKTIQKCKESFRLTKDQKDIINKLKK